MEIDIKNYETVLIDYFDGNLHALEVAEVLLFLEQHPAIKNEFEALGTLPIEDNITINPDFKSNLKKLNAHQSLVEKSFNELIISQIEGDCTEKESIIINEIIESNTALSQLKNTFSLTKLVPDLTINYPNKQSLKRKEAGVFYLSKRFAAAATLLLLASLLFLIYRNTNNNLDKVEIALTNKSAVETNKIKEEVKVIETPIEKKMAKSSKLNNQNQPFIAPAKINKTTELLAAVKPNREDFKSLPVKPITILKSTFALNSSSISGEVLPVEIAAITESSNENSFLTIGNFMKKKIIERGKDNLIEKEKPKSNDELSLDPLTVASVGAGILEKTTGKKVFLSRSFDKSGSVKSYTFAAGDFKFERIK
jgi:hypothetical protein